MKKLAIIILFALPLILGARFIFAQEGDSGKTIGYYDDDGTFHEGLPPGEDINKELFNAVGDNNLEVVKYLISHGADVNSRAGSYAGTHTPLTWALGHDCSEIAKLLIDNGADVNAKQPDNETALSYAVMRNNIEFVKLLIDKGADVNAVMRMYNPDKTYTVLSWAEEKGYNEIAQILRQAGAQ